MKSCLVPRPLALLSLLAALLPTNSRSHEVQINWDQIQCVSKTTSTLQVVISPLLRRGSPIHDQVYSELKGLHADFVRYVPWLPYPRLVVAELEPPADHKTHWDFSLIDPLMADFMAAAEGHPVVVNFSTIPAWMFRTPIRVTYPQDPNEAIWTYTQGTVLRDSSLREISDYYARLVSWYTRGGFTDEYGQRHDSGHHYKMDYWEVFNEPDLEHKTTPEQYTERYDAIVAAIKKVAPQMKFVGISLALPSVNPRMFEYFLDHRHHRSGTPLDMISYHFYAIPSSDQTPEVQSYTFFEQADRFIATVRYIEVIRQRLSPATGTMVNEIGSILPDDHKKPGGMTGKNIPASYWNLSGALYAYVFANLASFGIEVAGESQLEGYPSFYPSVSMVDWTTGRPNACYRIFELLEHNFHPGDKIVPAATAIPAYVHAYAVITPEGDHKVLLINKRDREFRLTLPQPAREVQFVDQNTAGGVASREFVDSKTVRLRGLEVAVVTLAARKGKEAQ